MGASAPILIIYPIHALPIRFSEEPKDFVAVYFVLTSSISPPPILLAKALYRSPAIAPVISVMIPRMIGKITMAERLKTSTPGRDFSNPNDTPKSANKHPQKRPNTIPNSALILATDIISTLFMTAIGTPEYDNFVLPVKRIEYCIQQNILSFPDLLKA
jgi:hypothetical protein